MRGDAISTNRNEHRKERKEKERNKYWEVEKARKFGNIEKYIK